MLLPVHEREVERELQGLLDSAESGSLVITLQGSGRRVEVPLQARLVVTLDEDQGTATGSQALRRIPHRALLPGLAWEDFAELLERECARLGLSTPAKESMAALRRLSAGRVLRGSDPSRLIQTLLDVALARRLRPELTPELVSEVWEQWSG